RDAQVVRRQGRPQCRPDVGNVAAISACLTCAEASIEAGWRQQLTTAPTCATALTTSAGAHASTSPARARAAHAVVAHVSPAAYTIDDLIFENERRRWDFGNPLKERCAGHRASCRYRGRCARTGCDHGCRRWPGHRRKLRHRDRREGWTFRQAWIEARHR